MWGTTAATGGSGGTASGGGGGGGSGGAGTGGVGTGGSGELNGLTLSSPDLAPDAVLADKYTCAVAGFEGSLSPELAWSAGPEGTNSYAITFIDTDLVPADEAYHWVIHDIPANVLGLPEELADASAVGAKQNRAYLGPCPNYFSGDAEHHYEFTLYALDAASVTLSPTTGTGAVKDAVTKLEADHLAKATLVGRSSAAPP